MKRNLESGFTLVELIIVVAIISILAAIAVPVYQGRMEKARETALKNDLYILRDSIDKYYADHFEYAPNLEALADERYIREVPVDPITKKKDWQVVPSEIGENDVFDVKSASAETASDGRRYCDW